jgi:hypothetical protein
VVYGTEWRKLPLQGLEIFGTIVYGIPPIFIGTFFGYILGSRERIPHLYRILISAIISVGGGYFLAQYALNILIPVTFNFIILSIMGFAGGVILGMLLNWKPYVHEYVTENIVYELDDDDEFDRELDEALHGSS